MVPLVCTVRNTRGHTYNEEKAEDVYAIVPDFLEEARFLLAELTGRSD